MVFRDKIIEIAKNKNVGIGNKGLSVCILYVSKMNIIMDGESLSLQRLSSCIIIYIYIYTFNNIIRLEFNILVLIHLKYLWGFSLKPYNVDDGLLAFDAKNFIIALDRMLWDMLWMFWRQVMGMLWQMSWCSNLFFDPSNALLKGIRLLIMIIFFHRIGKVVKRNNLPS